MFDLAAAERGLTSPYNDLLVPIANGYGVDPNLVRAIIARESGWDATAVNPSDPSYGLMQVLQGSSGPYPMYTADQLLDPATNLSLGIQFLAHLIQRFGETSAAISAYNEGEGRYLSSGIINQPYVDDVQQYWAWYANHPTIFQNETGTTDGTIPLGTLGELGGWGVIALVILGAALLAVRR